MQLVHSHKTSSYTFILTEDEWYSGTEQQKEAWIVQIMREGREAKCNNLNILVKPDGVMSISPVGHTHSVFTHIVRDNSTKDMLYRDLMALCGKYIQPGKLSIEEFKAVVEGALK